MTCTKTLTRRLWAGDNLEMLGELETGSASLAYLDPPFNSGRAYDARVGSPSRKVGTAFSDTWRWDDAAEDGLRRLSEGVPRRSAELISSLVGSLGRCDMSAYLVMMAPRLSELKRVLSTEGSLYVHCDPAASHYLKVILDLLFGPENFRNEIVWKRTHAHSSSRRFGPVHDVILFYGLSGSYTWNQGYAPYDHDYLDKYFRHEDERGRYQLITCTAPGARPGTRAHYAWRGMLPPRDRHWAWTEERMEELDAEGSLVYSPTGVPRLKRYVFDGQGVRLQDIWTDVNPLGAHSKERTGYETQKPIGLLERIVAASSNPGDLVVDPFGGTGTTAAAAESLSRSWATADRSLLASALTLSRVRAIEPSAQIALSGFVATESAARRLLAEDPTGFAVWATAMLGTLLDRDSTTPALAVGSRSGVGRSSRALTSWVPLLRDTRSAVPSLVQTVRDRHALLATNAGASALERQLADFGAIDVTIVQLADAVSARALRRGGVAAVLA